MTDVWDQLRKTTDQGREGGASVVRPPVPAQSWDDLRQYAKQQRPPEQDEEGDGPGLLRSLAGKAAVPFRMLRDAVKGPQDPAEAETPGLTWMSPAVERAKVVTFDDDAYADIIQKDLGNRFISMERDANNYPIVSYIGHDGKPRREYINVPGLDMQDVDRGLSSAIPFMLGAGAANLGLRAVGTTGVLPRMAAHTLAAGGSSVAADQVAGSMGSEQGTDWTRAGMAAAGGGIFEGLSGPMTRLWEAIFRRHPVGADGKLAGEAADLARRSGLDPDDMSERLTRDFARDANRAADLGEVGAKFRTGEFDIPTTRGQRTKNSDFLGSEEEMRRGLMGRETQSVMRDFDTRQKQAIEGAVRETVPGRVAPQAGARDVPSLGTGTRDGLRTARDLILDEQDKVWARVGPMFPDKEGAFAPMPGHLKSRLDEAGVIPDPRTTPQTHNMLEELESYARRETTQPGYALLPSEVNVLDVDGMRRRLLGRYRSAERGSADEKSAKAVYDSFNDWIDDAAERAMLSGSPDSAAALRAARGFTREMKELFEPRGAKGQMTPAARKIASVLDEADSGEGVIRALFGSGNPRSAPPEGSVQALQHMREMLVRTGQERTWDDIRMAYWLKLAQDNKGGILSPGRLQGNIDGAFANQKTLMDTLFSATDQAYMTRLARALDDVVYTPPNASGTSYELERMRRNAGGEPILKTILSTQAKRELFSKGNVLMSRIYSGLAKRIPNVANMRDASAMPLARRATSQDVQRRRPGAYFIAPTGAFAGVKLEEE
jgi:hypothetical protein